MTQDDQVRDHISPNGYSRGQWLGLIVGIVIVVTVAAIALIQAQRPVGEMVIAVGGISALVAVCIVASWRSSKSRRLRSESGRVNHHVVALGLVIAISAMAVVSAHWTLGEGWSEMGWLTIGSLALVALLYLLQTGAEKATKGALLLAHKLKAALGR